MSDAQGEAPSFDTVRALAESFAASLTATAFRYVHLDVSPSALVCCSDRRVSWSLLSDSFPYRRVRRDGTVHAHTGAGEYFGRGSTSSRPEPTPTAAWFYDAPDLEARCLEHCCPMPSYGSTLSLIWEG